MEDNKDDINTLQDLAESDPDILLGILVLAAISPILEKDDK